MSHQENLVSIGSDPKEQEEHRLQERMARVGRRLVVVSGKGGVGKSTAAANLAIQFGKDDRIEFNDGAKAAAPAPAKKK